VAILNGLVTLNDPNRTSIQIAMVRFYHPLDLVSEAQIMSEAGDVVVAENLFVGGEHLGLEALTLFQLTLGLENILMSPKRLQQQLLPRLASLTTMDLRGKIAVSSDAPPLCRLLTPCIIWREGTAGDARMNTMAIERDRLI
jgi:hypothetical protein